MIRARQEGRSEVELIGEMSAAHQRDFADFEIRFDHYWSTHSKRTEELCGQIWRALRRRTWSSKERSPSSSIRRRECFSLIGS